MYGVSSRHRVIEQHEPARQDYFPVGRKSSEATVIHRPSTTPDATPWESSDVTGMPIANKENEWLGFCPSAVRLQNGDKKGALRKRTDYAASFAAAGLTTYYCSMKGCVFQGHSSVDFAWKTVMKDDRLGIKCRWPFLAKSHVKQRTVVARQYQFQCPICIYTHGHAEGRIWKGIELFMEHVSTHRGKDLSPDLIHKLHIINDRAADEKEDFDINLIPPQSRQTSQVRESVSTPNPMPANLSRVNTFSSFADSIWSRKASTALDLTRTQTARSDRADSVFSSMVDLEPTTSWSEGLSDFKMDKEEDYLSPDF